MENGKFIYIDDTARSKLNFVVARKIEVAITVVARIYIFYALSAVCRDVFSYFYV